MRRPDRGFWQGRRVLVTGHTGFKGSWLTQMLTQLGAKVIGIALPPEETPNLFDLLAGSLALEHHVVDIRDGERLAALVAESNASLVLHLAAQSLVQRGYRDPVGTYAVNLTGTIHLLQALRRVPGIEAALIITTDKVYRNDGSGRRFIETDPLGGEDPYSASKAAAEITVPNWAAAFAAEMPRLATARAGNVLGGGDFSEARLIPDIVRAADSGPGLTIRNPQATRPWQHVADVLTGYLLYLEDMVRKPAEAPPALNFGPDADSEVAVAAVLDAFRPHSAHKSRGRTFPTHGRRRSGWRSTRRWHAAVSAGSRATISMRHSPRRPAGTRLGGEEKTWPG
jgi:CDP-glucose 4,6-dehydratase